MKSLSWFMATTVSMTLAVAACAVDSTDPADDDGGFGGAASGSATGTAPGLIQGTGAGFENCLVQPDFGSCIDCLCVFDAGGCDAYDNLLVTTLACGQTCGSTGCAAFCTGGALEPGCVACVNGISNPNPDLDAFVAQCEVDPVCSSFVGQLQSCPN